ncbi:MAG: bifunctional UDP-N-acetylglucosamine diphosphorylase/glucosamine-1-phosphate N-acetyltransferase GlmU [Syntrophobacterales bacterium]|jgi:bifunctional UDP-N-acetylglucosamine pyrophosphorylase/glucosamine-1-phosphate N-acetyltransferase|nr:bifunctional UDP-N-acetylglucosamine diphosphorylase/glucosamine-1-phosphate N-acetyltransferase GlmU [Syntrophobacterales bacterium]
MKGLNIVILAAGKGERMVSSKSKVMHRIMGKPMIGHVVDRAETLYPEAVSVVVGYQKEQVEGYLKGRNVRFCIQTEQKGTAHALLTTESFLRDGPILVLYGDVPLMEDSTLKNFLDTYKKTGEITFMITDVENPKGYGRVITKNGLISKIVEENDTTEEQKKITAINTGICIMPRNAFDYLKAITPGNKKGEYYLTDICDVAQKDGRQVRSYHHRKASEVLGINTRRELLNASIIMKDRILDRLMNQGVTLLDRNIYVETQVTIGKDTIIYPNCYLTGNTSIGEDVTVGPNCVIHNSTLKNSVVVESFVNIDGAEIEEGAVLGPFSRVRPASVIGKRAKIGNFVEIKNSTVKEGAKASHLSYIGDSEIGRNVNIGAGTITCNYDGKKKNKTVIEDNAFIGSNTALVAPITVGRNTVIGAGSTITKNVPEDALAVARAPQKHIKGYGRRR